MKTFCTGIVIGLFLIVFIETSGAAKRCRSSSECKRNQCCLSNEQRRGKRQAKYERFTGTCQPLKNEREGCLVSNGSGTNPKKDYGLNCPCQLYLECRPNGIKDIPWGPLGNCEPLMTIG